MSNQASEDELRQILKDTVKHHNDGPTPWSFCNEYDDCDHVARIEELIKQRELALLERLEGEKKRYITELAWKNAKSEEAIPLSAIEQVRKEWK